MKLCRRWTTRSPRFETFRIISKQLNHRINPDEASHTVSVKQLFYQKQLKDEKLDENLIVRCGPSLGLETAGGIIYH